MKGTFELSAGGKAAVAEEQPFPTGDEFYPDDEDMQGGPRYESDFAYFKPRADLLLAGKCYPPGGKPAQTSQATFSVGAKSKTLTVVGNRRWERQALHYKATEAEPFTEMELRYENSYGGEGYKHNPVGRGYRKDQDEGGKKVQPLPNIEDPQDLLKTRHSYPDPAGFGPLGRMWQTRHEKMGTYKGKYLKTRWPWFPEDFDWSHFNAAPEDMQLEGYLRGDEQLCFENLHPEHSQYEARLPGLRVRCFLNKLAASDSKETQFVEVAMNLDTLWVDMEAEKLVLVWRGWAEVLSEDYEEVQQVFITSEPVEQEPASLEQCHQEFLARQAEEEEAAAVAPEEPEEEAAAPEAPGEAPPGEEGPRIDPAQLEAQTNALLGQMGIDAKKLPPEFKAKQAQLIRKLTETNPEKLAKMQHRELESQLRDTMGKLGLDIHHLPRLSTKAKTEQLRFMRELGIKGGDVGGDPEFERLWAMTAAILPKAGIDPENLTPLINQAKKQQERLKKQLGIEEEEEEAAAAEAEKPAAFSREAVQEQAAKGESLEGADLHGLDLSGLDMKGIDLSEANLAGANLQNAVLAGANLTDANLTDADLSAADLTTANLAAADLSAAKLQKACLRQADLTGAKLVEADLTAAILDEAVFEEANLTAATMAEASAAKTFFPMADLTGARFKKGVCPNADFSKATLNQADFEGSNLREASVEGAAGLGINLTEADLTLLRAAEGCDFSGGVFFKAIGDGSIWEKANLTESDFRYARMQGATFTGACLKQADLSAANMKFGRFNKANLTGAKLVLMNLFKGTLEKADLTEADIRGSNMYGVEFLDAVIHRTTAKDTNLKMTKLHEK